MSKNFQKFKKKIGTMVVTAGMLIATTMTVNADTLNITNHAVNFRENASKKSDIINTLPKGTEVSVLGTEKNWVKVGYNGQTGYIYKTHLDTITKKIGTVKVGNSRLNVRNKSSMSGKIIGKLYTGNKVEIKGENNFYLKLPLTVVIVLLIFGFWMLIPLVVIGLFLNVEFSMLSKEVKVDKVNNILNKISKEVKNIKEKGKVGGKK